jgi:hypothetical protein
MENINKEEIINDWEKEIEEQFIEILDYGNDLTSEDVWTDVEKIQWLRKSMKSLISSTEKRVAKEYKDALIWCSGSEDFQIDGKAREGWEKICLPLIKSKYE